MILVKTRSVRRFDNKLRRIERRLIRKARVNRKRKRRSRYVTTRHKIRIVRRIRRKIRVDLIIRRILRHLRRFKRTTVKQRDVGRRRKSKSFRPNSKISLTMKKLVRRKKRIARNINRLFRRLGRHTRRRLLRRYVLLKKIITRGIRTILKPLKKRPKLGGRRAGGKPKCCADLLKAMKHCHCCHRCCYNKRCCNKKRSCPPGYYLTRSRGKNRCVKRCKQPYKRYFYKGKWYCRRPCQLGYKRYGPNCRRVSCPRGYKIQIRMKKVFCVKKRCPKGFFRVKGKGTCIKISCPKGYKRVKKKCVAKKCKIGFTKVITKKGAVCVRKVCARGYKLNKEGNCAFYKCPRGYSKKKGIKHSYCIKKTCKVGYRKYKTKRGKILCVKISCPVGHKVVKGHCKFFECPNGKTPLRVLKRVYCVKKTCPDGRLLNKHNKCVRCPIGYWPMAKGGKKGCTYRGCPIGYYSVGRRGNKQCIKMPRCYYPFVRKKMKDRWLCVKFRCPRFYSMRKSRKGRPYCVRVTCPLGYRFNSKRGCLFRKCPKRMATVKVGKRYHCVSKCACGYRRKRNSMKCVWHGCPRGFNMYKRRKTRYCVKVQCRRGYKRVKRKGRYLCIQIVCRWGYRVKGSKCVLYKCRKGSTINKDRSGRLYCKKKTCPRSQMKVSAPDGTVYCIPTGCGPNEKMIDGHCMAVGKMDIEKQKVQNHKKASLETIGAKTVTKSTIKTKVKGITIMTKAKMKIVCQKLRLQKIGQYISGIQKSMRILKKAVASAELSANAGAPKQSIQASYSITKAKVDKLLKTEIHSVVKEGPYKKIISTIRRVRKSEASCIGNLKSIIRRARKKKQISTSSFVACNKRLARAKLILGKSYKKKMSNGH